jgi:hypothetical protein
LKERESKLDLIVIATKQCQEEATALIRGTIKENSQETALLVTLLKLQQYKNDSVTFQDLQTADIG